MEESGNISLGSEAKRWRKLYTVLHKIKKLIQTRPSAAGLTCLTSSPLVSECLDPQPGPWGASLKGAQSRAGMGRVMG